MSDIHLFSSFNQCSPLHITYTFLLQIQELRRNKRLDKVGKFDIICIDGRAGKDNTEKGWRLHSVLVNETGKSSTATSTGFWGMSLTELVEKQSRFKNDEQEVFYDSN